MLQFQQTWCVDYKICLLKPTYKTLSLHKSPSLCHSSIILYFGAEFTKAYATTDGGLIQPNQYAVWVKQVEVETGTGSLKQNEQKKKEENEATGDDVKVK